MKLKQINQKAFVSFYTKEKDRIQNNYKNVQCEQLVQGWLGKKYKKTLWSQLRQEYEYKIYLIE